MWLIRASDKVLVEAIRKPLPAYAILSHVWEKEKHEVTFQDMQDPQKASEMETFAKIRETCVLALKKNLKYVWVDTCCINKQDSTELSEAINSMYDWYKDAELCYTFLSDVHSEVDRWSEAATVHHGLRTVVDSQVKYTEVALEIRESKWFKRGWTLQELIAPKNVVFVNRYWKELGTKETLATILRERTGIPEDILILNKKKGLSSQSVAQRMSWASDRETTRKEDLAYCLLGIFGVNIPMLYGEGETRAFLRLQEEIIRSSDDHSIFSWRLPAWQSSERELDNNTDSNSVTPHQSKLSLHGLLAHNPEAFRECREVRKTTSRKGRSAYTMTNRGLSIKLTAILWSMNTYLVRLYCDDNTVATSDGAHGDSSRLGILLTRLYEDDQYARIATASGESIIRLDDSRWNGKGQNPQYTAIIDINVPQNPDQVIAESVGDGQLEDLCTRHVSGFRLPDHQMFRWSYWNACPWNSKDSIMEMKPLRTFGRAARLEIQAPESKVKIREIKVGFDFDCNPTCFVATKTGLREKVPFQTRNNQVSAFGDVDNRRSTYNSDERMGFLGIDGRDVFDTTAWTVAWSRISGNVATELGLHPGMWALKGDRLDGLNVKLCEQSGKSLGDLCIERVAIKSGDEEGHLVWQLSLTVEEEEKRTLGRFLRS